MSLTFAKHRDKGKLLRKAMTRMVKIFVIGLLIQGGNMFNSGYNMATLRISGILQRIAFAFVTPQNPPSPPLDSRGCCEGTPPVSPSKCRTLLRLISAGVCTCVALIDDVVPSHPILPHPIPSTFRYGVVSLMAIFLPKYTTVVGWKRNGLWTEVGGAMWSRSFRFYALHWLVAATFMLIYLVITFGLYVTSSPHPLRFLLTRPIGVLSSR